MIKEVKTAELNDGKVLLQATFENSKLLYLDILFKGKSKSGRIDSGEVEQLTKWLDETVLNGSIVERKAVTGLQRSDSVNLPKATKGDPFENRRASSKLDDLSPIEKEERELMGAGQPEMIDNSKQLGEPIRIAVPKGFVPKK